MTRPGMFHEQDNFLLQTINKCLALSNIIRGLSFIPGNERTLCNHLQLLKIVSILLRLFTKDDENNCEDVKFSLFNNLIINESKNIDDENEDVKEPDDKKTVKQELTIDQKKIKQNRENRRQLLIETANHLRDDAFAVLAHISVQVNFYFYIFDNFLIF